RASGGPSEQTFQNLVGLQLRPRRLRAAAELWQSVGQSRGNEGRDALWAHPDLLPSNADLDDPAGFVQRDKEFTELLAGLDDVESLADLDGFDKTKPTEMPASDAAGGDHPDDHPDDERTGDKSDGHDEGANPSGTTEV
ncbi:MAG: zinc-dependent metalloprotease, partial [Actinomycetota bacterium]|nr:zinc-dependent metalloprotease [Actinomycetota bacterium]